MATLTFLFHKNLPHFITNALFLNKWRKKIEGNQLTQILKFCKVNQKF